MDSANEKSIGSWRVRLAGCFKDLSQIEKAYLVGLVLAAVASLALPAGIERRLVTWIFLLAGLFLCGSLAREAYVFVARQLESMFFKWLLVPAAVVVSAYSLGRAANLLNTATGQDPGLFPRATTFMAPVAAVPALALLVSVLAASALLVMLLAWGAQLSSMDKNRSSKAWVLLGRAGGAIASLIMVSPLAVEESSFGRFSERAAGWMAQGLDMHIDRSCASGEWDRVLRINDDLVLVARRMDGRLEFRRATCVLSAEQRSLVE